MSMKTADQISAELTPHIQANNAAVGYTNRRLALIGDGQGNAQPSTLLTPRDVFYRSSLDQNDRGVAILAPTCPISIQAIVGQYNVEVWIGNTPGSSQVMILDLADIGGYATGGPTPIEQLANAGAKPTQDNLLILRLAPPTDSSMSVYVDVGKIAAIAYEIGDGTLGFAVSASVDISDSTNAVTFNPTSAALTSGQHRLLGIALDPVTGQYFAIPGTAVTATNTLPSSASRSEFVESDYQAIDFTGYYPCGYLYNYYGQAIPVEDDIMRQFDPRLIVGKMGAAAGGTVTDVTASAPLASSGGTTPDISHNASGVTPGSYTNTSLTVDTDGHVTAASNGSAATGDVVGPGSAVNNDLAAFDSTTGKLIKDSGILTSNVVTGPASAVSDDFAMFNGAGGKIIKDSGLSLTTDGTLAANSDSLIPSEKAVKAYVDAVAQGLSPKASVKAASAAALPSNVYVNGVLGVGATLTGIATGVLTVDGVTVALNDRLLIKDESAQANNGIYKCTVAGAVGVLYVLTRTIDSDTSDEIIGSFVFVEAGTVNADSGWVNTNTSAITIGTTAITYTQFSGAGEITAGDGLSKTGNTLAVDSTVVRTTGAQSVASKTINSSDIGTTTPGLGYFSALRLKIGGFFAIFTHAFTADRTVTIPGDADVTLVGVATAQTLTSKTLTTPIISGGSIDSTPIGGTTPAAIAGTTVNASGVLTTQAGRNRHERVVTAAGSVTVTSADDIVTINKTVGAATTVNLPASPAAGDIYTIKDGKGDSATNNITIDGISHNINGGVTNTIVLSANYGSMALIYNGATWDAFIAVVDLGSTNISGILSAAHGGSGRSGFTAAALITASVSGAALTAGIDPGVTDGYVPVVSAGAWDKTNSLDGAIIGAGTVAAARLGVMTADSGSGGAKGAVPAPTAGDAIKAFFGDATFVGAGRELVARTVLGASVASIDLNPVSTAYEMLLLIMELRSDRAASTVDNVYIRFNNDSTAANYYSYSIIDSGTTPTETALERLGATATGIEINQGAAAATATADERSYLVVQLYSYADSARQRHAIINGMGRYTTATGNLKLFRGLGDWTNAANAINRITILPVNGSNWVAGSSYMLYGFS